MTELTHLALDADEMAILVDALEADLAGYLEAAKEADDEGNGAEAANFGAAAQRVQAVLDKVRGESLH